jgi:hypothetical protein
LVARLAMIPGPVTVEGGADVFTVIGLTEDEAEQPAGLVSVALTAEAPPVKRAVTVTVPEPGIVVVYVFELFTVKIPFVIVNATVLPAVPVTT